MASMLTVEWHPADPPATCACCGGKAYRLTRFVTADGDAFAVVYAAFTDSHRDQLIKFAVSVGDWSADDVSWRRCFTVWYKNLPESYGFMIRDPVDGDWQDVGILGRHLSRDLALRDPQLDQVWAILDIVVTHDPVLSTYLRDGLHPDA